MSLEPHPLTVATLLLATLCACGGDRAREGASEHPAAAPPGVKSPAEVARAHGTFDGYWYRGLAELSRYRLRQSRYGEVHEGEAVLVFVTEPFLPDAQVKQEHGDPADAVSVLKLNAYRRFYTGIYPYTVMTSTFSPVAEAGALPLKASASVQEWCGHAYAQLNRREGHYELALHSYFQDEGDAQARVPKALLEDGLFAWVRRDPSTLPIGEISLVSGLHHLRFVHRPVAPEPAVARRTQVDDARFSEASIERYEVRYPESGRTLRIYFEPAFPYAVLGWEELQEGAPATVAVRTHAIMSDYWNHHGANDGAYREALGLTGTIPSSADH